MDSNIPPSLSEMVRGAAAWWLEAGIDQDYIEEPRNWLKEHEDAQSEPAEEGFKPVVPIVVPDVEPEPSIGGTKENWPLDLPSFQKWWMEEPSLDLGGTSTPVPPRGIANPEWMILVPEPEEEDADHLLSGPEGKLLDAMFLAMGIEPAKCYFASILRRHTPLPDWDHLERSGMGEILLHHISLVGPKRLMVLGQSALPLLGHDPAQNPLSLREVNHGSAQTPVFISRKLGALIEKPAERARFWKRWLEWTEKDG